MAGVEATAGMTRAARVASGRAWDKPAGFWRWVVTAPVVIVSEVMAVEVMTVSVTAVEMTAMPRRCDELTVDTWAVEVGQVERGAVEPAAAKRVAAERIVADERIELHHACLLLRSPVCASHGRSTPQEGRSSKESLLTGGLQALRVWPAQAPKSLCGRGHIARTSARRQPKQRGAAPTHPIS